jgi:hypothetical protein
VTIILTLQGYVVALVALYAAYAPRRRRAPRLLRPALCSLAFIAAVISTLTMARVGGAGAVHLVSLAVSFSVAAACIGWLFVGTVSSFARPRRQSPPADVDFSFLVAPPENDQTGATEPARCPRPKLNHRRWIDRLKKIKFMQHRFSFLTDPP